jgi:hypothetical protein
MKKSIFALVLFMLALLSCNQGRKVNSVVKQDDRIGILHNQILDTIINDLWKEKINTFISEKSEKIMAKSYDKDFLLNKRIDLSHSALQRGIKNSLPDSITDADILSYIPKDKFASIAKQGKKPTTRSSSTPLSADMQNLTPWQQKYYKKLLQILSSKNLSLEQVLLQISEQEQEAVENSPTPEEAEQLLLFTSVARHSAQYWAENFKKWILLNSEVINVTVDNVKQVATKGVPETGILPNSAFPSGYYAYPEHPEYFIYVPEGQQYVAVVAQCPAGLYFNPLICACDWPDDVINSAYGGESNFWANLASSDIGGAVSGSLGGWRGALIGAIGASGGAALSELFN